MGLKYPLQKTPLWEPLLSVIMADISLGSFPEENSVPNSIRHFFLRPDIDVKQ
jgi:hypothetical protein